MGPNVDVWNVGMVLLEIYGARPAHTLLYECDDPADHYDMFVAFTRECGWLQQALPLVPDEGMRALLGRILVPAPQRASIRELLAMPVMRSEC
jgi:hypothetical protein